WRHTTRGRDWPRRCAVAFDPGGDQAGIVIEYEFARSRWHERRTAHHPAAACDEGRQRAGDNEPVTGRGIDIERQRAGGAEETLQYLPCDEVAACPRRHIDRCWRCGCASIRNHKMRPVAD